MKRFWPAAWMLIAGFAGNAFAAPFQNGGFEIGTPTSDPCNIALPIGSTAITGWTVISGNIEYITTCWTPSEGARSLDLVGNGSIGGIRQTFDTISGATYQVSFDLAGNPSLSFNPPNLKPLSVTVAGTPHNYTFNVNGHTAASMGWATQTFTFTAIASSTTIDFVSDVGSLGSSFAGAALDNVSIVRTFAATSTTLFGTPNPSVSGGAVTFTVQIHGTVNSPTGTVNFTVDGSPIPGCAAIAAGPTGSSTIATADCVTSSLVVGTHTIAATYSGDVLNAGSTSSPWVQTVNPPASGPTAWTGSAGSVTNNGVPIGSLPSVISDGTAGTNAVFTYATINDYCCHTGDWNFETIATASGDVTRNWTYSGYHGTCQAQASLTAYIRRSGVEVYSASLYSAADDCVNNLLPAGGFGVDGQVVFPGVQAGDTYGFRMHSYNYDYNGAVLGRLTVTTGTSPTTTTVGTSANPIVYGTSSQLSATVSGNAPTGTVTFTQEGRIIFGCDAVPMFAGTASCWTILPSGARNIVALYSGDTTNVGSVSSALLETVNAGPPAASFVVNSTVDSADAISDGNCADSNGLCSLRAAVMEANASPSGATVTVPAGTYTLTIGGGLDISRSVTINGAGAASTIVDGGGIDRVFNVSSGVVTISGLTVRNGYTNGGNAGAGIKNVGSLTLNQVVVSGNTSSGDAGGIFNQGTLLALNGSTVSGNVGGGGAGIFSFNSTLTLTNSTISGNHSINIGQCGFGGGGLWVYAGQATITNSTLFDNFAECSGGAGGRGHAIATTYTTATIRNSILASPGLGGQMCYGPVTSLGYNLFGDATCSQVGTDLIFPNPQLNPLAIYNGPTPTNDPLLGSPARDAVPAENCATALDQTGLGTADSHGFLFRRPQGPACDIGAVESAPLPIQVPTTTSLASVPNPAVVGASVTFTATVTTTVPGSDPTGFVDIFFAGGLTLDPGCLGLPLTGTGDSRTAACTTTLLPLGSSLIGATYNGNLTNQISSGTATQVMTAASGPPAFYGISSITTNTIDDGTPVTNLIEGQGAGFDAISPYDQRATGALWYTSRDCVPCNYFDSHPAPVLTLDLGQDRALSEISVWGYPVPNNGVRQFRLRFATAADGPAGFGTSVTFNPTYSMQRSSEPLDVLPRQAFAFGQTLSARYVEFTALNNYWTLATQQDGGDRVGLGEIAFKIPVPLTATTTTLASAPNPAALGASVTFTATVTTLAPGSNPTGTVDFFNNVLPLCSAVPLNGSGDSRTAICATSSLPVGNWLISAQYNGDINNQSSSGATTQAINAAAPTVGTPSLVRVVEDTGGGSTIVIGRVDGAPPNNIYWQAYTAASCVAGVPSGISSVGLLPPFQMLTIPTQSGVQLSTDGYFAAAVPNVASGQFLVIQLTNPSGMPISSVSSCVPSLGGNDFWTTALLVGGENTSAGSSSAGDYIDASGKTRWFKFKVAPGQRIAVTLSGLPADYDLALFKDIGAAFAAQLAPADSADLTKLSAEFAPSAFSPSAFSPSAFSPSAFSPSAFSPSAFSPSAFSPSAFSPSAFSPSAFSPSAFSPSAFSPSAFSPSAFSPSAFSPSAFSPSAFSPSAFSDDVIFTAFSSAQTRSIIAVSATPGTGDESAVVDSWNNSGYFYARVTGRGAAYSSTGQFNIAVTKGATSCAGVSPLPDATRSAPGSTYTTVILTDSLALSDGTLTSKLLDFAGRGEIAGKVVDVASDARVQALKTQASTYSDCPYATNLVAEEIKSIVDAYRNPNLKYVVIAGGDDVVPFFRYPDESLLGQESGYVPPVTGISDASLRGDYVLSQDAYGSKTRISQSTSDFPVPNLAVGRLVKTPTEIAGMIDAYLSITPDANGKRSVVPGSSLVTGYDFLADVADKVTLELGSGIGTSPDTLIAENDVAPEVSWTATQLGAALFSGRHDVVFLGGHFSANSALAADFATNLITSDLAASTTDFTNSLVFSAGCHSGYSIVNRDAVTGATFTLDWAQAFAQKKATLVAGTGYQYGDTDFIEYSERLYLNFAKELRVGSGPVAIGEALVKAKLDYLAATPEVRGIHKKALLESTLYGLPMLGVNMPPSGRTGAGSVLTAVIPTDPADGPAGTDLGLRIATLNLTSSDLLTTLQTKQLTGATLDIAGPTVSWLSGNVDGVVSNPAEPALPLKVVNVTPTVPSTGSAIVLRGVGFRGGDYSDSVVVPLTGAPATEIRGVHTSFASPYFFPMRLWTVNYFGALAGNGATSLLVTPAQHRVTGLGPDPTTGALSSTLRQFTKLDLRLYYSGNYGSGNGNQEVSLSDAPTIVSVGAEQTGSSAVTFTAQVTGDPAAVIHQVWVVYTNGGSWVPVDLKQCIATLQTPLPVDCGTTTDSQIWKLTAGVPPGTLEYVVQAANGLGLVSFDDNRGAYYTFTGLVAPQEAASTALSFVAAPSAASYGDAVSVTARLTSGGVGVAGSVVTVNIGGMPNAGTTGSDGSITFNAIVANAPGNYQIEASYIGSSAFAPATVKQPFAVNKATASLVALPSPAIGVQLTAPVVNNNATTQEPVPGQAVSFLLTSPGASQAVVVTTDSAGNATLPATATTGLPAGTYSIAASFLPASVAGNVANYNVPTLPVTLPTTFIMNAQSITFNVVNSLVYGSSVSGSASSDKGLPVTLSVSPASAPFCVLTGAGPTYTLSAKAATPSGSFCSLVASAVGTSTIANATASKNVSITKSPTATSVVPSPSSATLGQTVTLTATITPATLSPSPATGTVQFLDGGNPVGTPVAIANGVATLSSSGFTVGSHALTAAYSGDGNYAASTSTPASTLAVNAPGTTTTLASSVNPSVFGQSVTLTATVTAGAGVPNGLVTFFDGTTQLGGSVNLNSGGVATFTTSALSTGSTHALKAVYAGTPSFATSTSTLLTQVVNLAGSTTTVSASSNPAVVGQPVTLSATVAPVSPGTGTPTGTVTFKDSATTLGSSALAGGAASLSTNALAVGGHSITASYAGDPTKFLGSTSAPALTVTINPKSTSTVLTADKPSAPSTILFGTTITLTAAVTPGTATGSVSFLEGSTALGTATLSGGTASTPAKATLATSTLTVGTHVLTAKYVGDTNDATSTSAPLTLVIKEAFTATGPMLQGRVSHTATRLNDGRVLVAGGSGSGDDDTRASRTAEIYCPNPYTPPATPVRTLAQWCPNGVGKFSPAGRGNTTQVGIGNLVQARTYHTATLLPNGTVLLAGGFDGSGVRSATAEIYDPSDPIADKFTAVANLPGNASASHTATLITKTGKVLVLVIGGGGSSSQTYDYLTKTWTVSGSMAGVRSNHTATLTPAGTKVLVAGGTDAAGRTLQTTTIYDIATGTFSNGPTMLAPREMHTASVVAGKILLAGGRASTGIITNSVALSPLAEIYDPSNATIPFAAAQFASGTGRFGHSASALIAASGQPDGRVLVTGGGVTVACGQQLSTSELFATSTFTSGAAMAAARVRHTATVLADGRVLVTGGRGATGSSCGPLSTAEIWNGPALH